MGARGDAAEKAARDARDHPVVDRLARLGFVAYGVVHIIIGWLAAQLALGDPAGSASGQGAFSEMAQKPWGAAALWLSALGLAALVVWQLAQAVGGHRDHDGLRRQLSRAGSAGRAVVLATLAVLAVRTAVGGGGGGSGGGGDGGGLTGAALGSPVGPALFVLAGAVVLGVAGASAWRGASDRWRKDLEVEGHTGHGGRAVEVLARAGYLSRAVALGVVGLLVVRAGLEDRPQGSGLDQAIVRYRDEVAGPWLAVAVAVGLACFGAYHLVRAWYLRAE
ncbi:hypothetical protein ASE01_17960 [Nocardioides sp. Root190]|uniref:DUF1206 domain-containing protein n=1 Tax=Nocardioides sp. Root190 TaxID=1736488 RepID=UPI0006FF883C|nr:DUF1206 domain-containing protein [Nocardioides sp. Root190]KRB73896.1 hypothetical protein ASE01_17960 [Nocardioides sp. Root190]